MCGRLTLASDQPTPDQLLFRLAYAKGITGRPNPMRPVPMVIAPDRCEVALWGWPSSRGTILTHVRSETAAELPTWRHAWKVGRGVVPVSGWEEGTWVISTPGAHLAVLFNRVGDGLRFAILTQPPPLGQHVERWPVPLTQDGAIAWLGGQPLGEQVHDVHVAASGGQQSIFDQ